MPRTKQSRRFVSGPLWQTLLLDVNAIGAQGSSSVLEAACGNRSYHKLLCKQFANFQNPPGPDVRRVIVLPERDTKPYFAWLAVPEGSDAALAKTKRKVGNEMDEEYGVLMWESEEVIVFPKGDEVFGTTLSSPRFVDLVCGKLGSGELLDHGVHLFKRDTAFGSVPNRCLAHLKKDEPGIGGRYPGPLVIVGVSKVAQPSITVDVDTSDFTLALDAISIRDVMMSTNCGVAKAMSKPKKIAAVKVNNAAPFFEGIKVPVRHPVYKKEVDKNTMVLVGAELFGPKLRIHKRDSAAAAASSPGPSETFDNPAAYLLINLDIDSPKFGTLPPSLNTEEISFLVATEGPKPLRAKYLAKVCEILKTDFFGMADRENLTPQQRGDRLVASVNARVRQAKSEAMEAMHEFARERQGEWKGNEGQ